MVSGDTKDLSELLSAYLDEELDEAAKAEVEAYLGSHTEAEKLLNELRETRDLLLAAPPAEAPPGLFEDIMAAAERRALLGDIEDEPEKIPVRRRWGPIPAAAAIVLLVGAASTWIFWQISQTELQLADSSSITAETKALQGTDAISPFEEVVMVERTVPEDVPSGGGGGAGGSSLVSRVKKMIDEHNKEVKRDRSSLLQPTPGLRITGLESTDSRLDQEKGETPATDEQQVVRLDTDIFDEGLRLREIHEVAPVVGKVYSAEANEMVENAVFLRQLATGVPSDKLAHYSFDNEVVELTMNFTSAAELDRFAEETTARFADEQFLDVADPLQRSRVVEPAWQNLFLRGWQGVNYQADNSRQYLVVASPLAIERLVDRYAGQLTVCPLQPAVEIRVGKLRAEGFEQTRTLAQLLSNPEWQEVMLGDRGRSAFGSVLLESEQETIDEDDAYESVEEWTAYYDQLVQADRDGEMAADNLELGQEKVKFGGAIFGSNVDATEAYGAEKAADQEGIVGANEPAELEQTTTLVAGEEPQLKREEAMQRSSEIRRRKPKRKVSTAGLESVEDSQPGLRDRSTAIENKLRPDTQPGVMKITDKRIVMKKHKLPNVTFILNLKSVPPPPTSQPSSAPSSQPAEERIED